MRFARPPLPPRAAAALAIWLAACGPRVVPTTIVEEDDPRAGARVEPASTDEPVAAAPMSAAPSRPLAAPGVGLRTGTIERADLVRVLDAGPGAILRAVELSPVFEGQRFVGWRLDQLVDSASPLARADLFVGDVVTSVNRRPLARPEHVLALWQALRSADALSAEIWRGTARLELTFAITPAITTPPVTPAADVAR